MGLILVLIVALCFYRNAKRAGRTPWKWVTAGVVAYIIAGNLLSVCLLVAGFDAYDFYRNAFGILIADAFIGFFVVAIGEQRMSTVQQVEE